MKAKEYFARLDGISKDDVIRMAKEELGKFQESAFIKTVYGILIDLLREGANIMKERNVQRDDAAVSVIKEIRDKWEAICRMIEQKYGLKSFDKQTFNAFIKDAMPEIAIMLPPDFWE